MSKDRRTVLTLLFAGFASPAVAQSLSVKGATMTPFTAYAFSFAGLKGDAIQLADYAGKPIMVVNTASLCGYTPQYAGLEQLFMRYHGRGFTIIGVPSNDFGGQEPGGAAEISETANTEYGVTFPLTAKADVKGPSAHPFYKWAAAERPRDTPNWNFHKYLVGRDGYIAAAFPSAVEPMDARVVEAVVKELGPTG
jgi:glutathione peroxidase